MKVLTKRQVATLENAIDVLKEVEDKTRHIRNDDLQFNSGVASEAADHAKTAVRNLIITLDCYLNDPLAGDARY